MKSKISLTRARITYIFKEIFRAHSKEEYREFLTRGLGKNKRGITGTYPWLYVRLFFVLFCLFTVYTVVLRLTGNTMFIPTVTLFGGITFTAPFMVFLFEIYPKRDFNVLKLLAILVIGGTFAGVISQIGYSLIDASTPWGEASLSAFIEEISKALVAVAAIMVMRNNNSYVCFLVAAAVGAGFSVMEDMGYIFNYSDLVAATYGDIRDTVAIFFTRGISSLCTHILWTGIVGWAYGFAKGRQKLLFVPMLCLSIFLHTVWNAPFKGWEHSVAVALCTIMTLSVNIVAVRKSVFMTMADEFDLARINRKIIREAKAMGERMRFTNAANLTFALTSTLLAIIALTLCCLPIGIKKMHVRYESVEEFISYIQGDYNLLTDWGREYDPDGKNVEVRSELNGDILTAFYVVQEARFEGYDGVYYYSYYIDVNGKADGYADSIFVELNDQPSRIPCVEYTFGGRSVWAFDVIDVPDYTYNQDGTVSAVTDADAFEGYAFLISLLASACAIAGACTVILTAFAIKLRRVQDDG